MLAGYAALLALLIAVLPASAADLEKPNLRLAVGGKILVAYLPLTIAERRGYFKKEGLEVEINDFQGGTKALQALVGGSADIGCGAYEHTLYMAAKGFPIKASRCRPIRSVSWSASRRTRRRRISRLQDLKGMKIGVTGSGLGERDRTAHAA